MRWTPRLTAISGVLLLAVGGCASPTTSEPPPPVEPPPRAPAPPPPAPEPVPTPELETIYFDFDKSNIRPDQRAVLQRNGRILSENGSLRVEIQGHCDERGSEEYNLALGQRRADSTRRYLMDLGVDGSRLSTRTFGEERPAVMGHNETAWSKNRRSEFHER